MYLEKMLFSQKIGPPTTSPHIIVSKTDPVDFIKSASSQSGMDSKMFPDPKEGKTFSTNASEDINVVSKSDSFHPRPMLLLGFSRPLPP